MQPIGHLAACQMASLPLNYRHKLSRGDAQQLQVGHWGVSYWVSAFANAGTGTVPRGHCFCFKCESFCIFLALSHTHLSASDSEAGHPFHWPGREGQPIWICISNLAARGGELGLMEGQLLHNNYFVFSIICDTVSWLLDAYLLMRSNGAWGSPSIKWFPRVSCLFGLLQWCVRVTYCHEARASEWVNGDAPHEISLWRPETNKQTSQTVGKTVRNHQ